LPTKPAPSPMNNPATNWFVRNPIPIPMNNPAGINNPEEFSFYSLSYFRIANSIFKGFGKI